MKLLSQHIESLIFTADGPLSYKEIKGILEEAFEAKFKKQDIEEAIVQIEERYKGDEFAFELVGIAEGYQFLTKGAYFNTVATFLKQKTKKRLSRAALETLSIIAYKQPVTRIEMENIRGVSCDYAIHKLLEKELVTILGRSERPGRPLLYGTSEKFMDYFGLKDMNDMPKPKDFRTPDNSIGEAAPIEEEVPNSNVKKEPLAPPANEFEEVVDIISAALPYVAPPKKEETEVKEEPVTDVANDASQITDNKLTKLAAASNELEDVVDTLSATMEKETIEKAKSETITNSDVDVQPAPAATESKQSDEHVEVENVITASIPVENIPSEAIVLSKPVFGEMAKSEEE